MSKQNFKTKTTSILRVATLEEECSKDSKTWPNRYNYNLIDNFSVNEYI